jgi:ribonuclease VapC
VIVDSSVLISILHAEADAPAMANALQRGRCAMSAVTFVETAIVIDCGDDPIASRRFDDLVREAGISIEPVTPRQAEIARAAYRDFGKGRHLANLNFGDCFAYALAKEKGEPLLFKGGDFCHTDVEPVDIDTAE